MAVSDSTNTVGDGKVTGRDIFDIKCLLEAITLKIEYKPIIVGAISAFEAFLQAQILALDLSIAPLEAAFAVIESTMKLIETAYDEGLQKANKFAGLLAIAGSCSALDDLVGVAIDEFDKTVKGPYNEFKQRYFRIKNLLNLQKLLQELVKALKKFFGLIKEEVNKLPDIPTLTIGGGLEDVFA